MKESELKEIFELLKASGMEPRLCDTPVPYYETKVPCGEPLDLGTPRENVWMMPRDMVSMMPEFYINVRGASMKDAGIVEGDVVKIVVTNNYYEGDIVLAEIDGETTLKVYYEDDDGDKWLVPQNRDFNPILLNGDVKVRFLGKVKSVIKEMPRVSSRVCGRIVKEIKKVRRPVYSMEKVMESIMAVSAMIKNGRQWFAVYRVMVDAGIVTLADYSGFCKMVKEAVPGHEFLPSPVEIGRLAIDSFKKPVAQWNPRYAPVSGKRFDDYLEIANKMQELTEEARM